MHDDWLRKLFDGRIEEIGYVVKQTCPPNWREADDVFGEVLLRIHRRHVEQPGYFVDKAHVLAFARKTTQFVLSENYSKARVDSRDPMLLSNIAEPEEDEASQEWQRLKTLLSDCNQILVMLADADERLREIGRLTCEGHGREEIVRRMKAVGFKTISKVTIWRLLPKVHELLRDKLTNEKPS